MRSGSNPTGRTQLRAGATGTRAHRMAAGAAEDGGGATADTESTSQESTEANGPDRAGDADGGEVQPEAPGFLRRGVQRVLELLSPQPKRPANSQRARTGHAADSGNDDDAHIPAGSDDRSMDVDGGGDAARPKSAAPDRRKPKTRGASSKKGGQGGRAKKGKATAKGRPATEEEDFDSDEAEARCEDKVKNRESLQNLNFDKMKRRELVVYAKFLLRNKGAVHGAKKDLVPQLNAERDRRLATWDEEDGEDLPEEREEGRAVFQREQEEEEQPQQADLEKQGAEEVMEGSSPKMNGPVAEAAQVGHDDQGRRREHIDIGGAEAAGDEMDGGMEGMEEERQEEIKHESTGPPGVRVYRPALYRPESRLNHEQHSISDDRFSPDPAFGQGRMAAPVETRMLPDTHRELTEKEKEDLLSTARRTRNKQRKEAASQPGTTGLVGPPRPGSAFGGYIPVPRPGGAVGRGDGLLEQHDAMPSRNEITSGDEELDFLAQRARDSNAPSFRNMHATRRERPAVHYDDQIDARDDLQSTRYAVTPFAASRLPTRYPPSSQRDARIRSREEMEGRGDDSEHRAKRRRQVEPSTPRWSDQVASRIKENVRNAQQRTPLQSGRRPYLPATSMRPLLFDDPAVEMSPPTRSEALPEPRTQQRALVSHRAAAVAVGRGMSAESRLGIEPRSAAKRQRDEAVREVSQVSNLPEPTAVFGDDGDVAGGGWEDDDAEFRFRAPLPVDEVPDDDGMEYDNEDRGPAREQDFTFTPAQKKRRRRQEEPEKSGQAKQASVGAAPSAAADRMAMPPPPPRPAAPRAPVPSAVPPAGGGFVGFDHLRPKGWKCNLCFVTDNPESTNICLSCEAPRPGTGGAGVGSGAATPAVSGVSPAQSKPFASSAPKSTGGSIGSSGFVFGNKSDAGGSSFWAFGSGASGPESRSSGLGAIGASSPPSALTSSAARSPAPAPSTANFFGSAAARTASERGFTAPAPAPPKSSKRVAAPTAPASDNTDAAYPGGDFEFVAGQTPPALTNAAPTPTAEPVPAPVPATSAPAGATTDTAPAPATSAASPAPAPTPAPFAFGGAGTGSLFGSVPAVSPSTSASGSAASGATPSAQAPFTFGTGDGKTGSGLGGGDGKPSAPSFTFPSDGAAFGSVSGPTSGAAPSTGGVTHGFVGAPPASTPSTTASAAPTPSAAPAPATTATTTSAPSSTTATTVSVAAPAPATSGLSLFPRTSTTLPATNFLAFGSAAGTSSSSGAPPTSSFVPFGSSSSAASTTSAPAAAPSTTTTTPSTVFSAPATGFGFGTTMVPGAPAKPATDASKTSTASTPGTGFSFGISGAGAAPLSFGLAAGTGATPAAGVVGRSTSGSGMDIAGGTSPKQQQPAGGLTLTVGTTPAPAPAGGLSLSLGSTPAPAPAPAPFAAATFGQTPASAPGFGFGALGSGSTTGPFAAPAPALGPTPFSSTPSGGLFGQGASGGGANPFSAGAAAPAPASFGGFGLSTGAGTGSGTPSFTFGSTVPSGPLLGTTPSQPTPTFGVSAPAPAAPVFGAGSAGGAGASEASGALREAAVELRPMAVASA